jgi:sRNA-binding protein
MAYKVNYAFQKAERARAKQVKKEAKARERKAQAAAGEGQQPEGGDEADLPAPLQPPGEAATTS